MAYGGNSGAGGGVGPLKKDSSNAICCCLSSKSARFLPHLCDHCHVLTLTLVARLWLQ